MLNFGRAGFPVSRRLRHGLRSAAPWGNLQHPVDASSRSMSQSKNSSQGEEPWLAAGQSREMSNGEAAARTEQHGVKFSQRGREAEQLQKALEVGSWRLGVWSWESGVESWHNARILWPFVICMSPDTCEQTHIQTHKYI